MFDMVGLRSIEQALREEGRDIFALVMHQAISEIERLSNASVGVNVGVKEGDVVGIPMLVKNVRGWEVLGEDGRRFGLMSWSDVGVSLKPCPEEPEHLCCYPNCTCAPQREPEAERERLAQAIRVAHYKATFGEECLGSWGSCKPYLQDIWLACADAARNVGVKVGVNSATPDPTATTSSP